MYEIKRDLKVDLIVKRRRFCRVLAMRHDWNEELAQKMFWLETFLLMENLNVKINQCYIIGFEKEKLEFKTPKVGNVRFSEYEFPWEFQYQ